MRTWEYNEDVLEGIEGERKDDMRDSIRKLMDIDPAMCVDEVLGTLEVMAECGVVRGYNAVGKKMMYAPRYLEIAEVMKKAREEVKAIMRENGWWLNQDILDYAEVEKAEWLMKD